MAEIRLYEIIFLLQNLSISTRNKIIIYQFVFRFVQQHQKLFLALSL